MRQGEAAGHDPDENHTHNPASRGHAGPQRVENDLHTHKVFLSGHIIHTRPHTFSKTHTPLHTPAAILCYTLLPYKLHFWFEKKKIVFKLSLSSVAHWYIVDLYPIQLYEKQLNVKTIKYELYWKDRLQQTPENSLGAVLSLKLWPLTNKCMLHLLSCFIEIDLSIPKNVFLCGHNIIIVSFSLPVSNGQPGDSLVTSWQLASLFDSPLELRQNCRVEKLPFALSRADAWPTFLTAFLYRCYFARLSKLQHFN